jgi:hypothetical protein
MKRTTIASFAVAAVAAGVAAVGGLAVGVHGGETSRHAQPPRGDGSLAGSPGADTRSAERKAEDTFIGATAAHLCNVGQTVYDDPKALADAYQSPPAYPGLTATQVADLTQRLRTDQNLSTHLARQLQTTCRPPTGR